MINQIILRGYGGVIIYRKRKDKIQTWIHRFAAVFKPLCNIGLCDWNILLFCETEELKHDKNPQLDTRIHHWRIANTVFIRSLPEKQRHFWWSQNVFSLLLFFSYNMDIYFTFTFIQLNSILFSCLLCFIFSGFFQPWPHSAPPRLAGVNSDATVTYGPFLCHSSKLKKKKI